MDNRFSLLLSSDKAKKGYLLQNKNECLYAIRQCEKCVLYPTDLRISQTHSAHASILSLVVCFFFLSFFPFIAFMYLCTTLGTQRLLIRA